MFFLIGRPYPRRNIPGSFDTQARVRLGAIFEFIESTGRFHHEHDVSHNRQIGLLESRRNGENRSSVLLDVAQGSAETQRKFVTDKSVCCFFSFG